MCCYTLHQQAIMCFKLIKNTRNIKFGQVNNKNGETTLFWCLYCSLWIRSKIKILQLILDKNFSTRRIKRLNEVSDWKVDISFWNALWTKVKYLIFENIKTWYMPISLIESFHKWTVKIFNRFLQSQLNNYELFNCLVIIDLYTNW